MKINQLLKTLRLKQIVTLDFETYFETGEYSLRSPKTSMSEYVRDKRFKAQCVAMQTNKQRKARWKPHGEIKEFLMGVDWENTALLAHNTAFDGFILSQHYGIRPAFYLDSLSMARPLFSNHIGAGLDEVAKHLGYAGKEKGEALQATKNILDLSPELMNPLGEYCADDVQDTFSIFKDMLAMDFPLDELKLIHHTIKAFADPACDVDVPLARKELANERRKKTNLFKRVIKSMHVSSVEEVKSNLAKNQKLADALERQHITVPMKDSPARIKDGTACPENQIFAFAKGDLAFQELQRHSNKIIKDLIEARMAVKSTIGETRAARMILRGTTGDCKLPLFLNYGKAHTLRWSGGDKFNPQNFVRGGNMRKCIKAPKGYKVVVVDSSQIEARMNAWLWGQNDLLELFATGKDPYKALASSIYGVPVDRITKAQRFVGKVGVLGLGYQMGADKFQYTLEAGLMGPPMIISLAEAEKAKNAYRRKNHRIVAGWRFLENMLEKMYESQDYIFKDILYFQKEAITTPSGFNLYYPEMHAVWNHKYEKYQDFSYKNGRKRSHIYGGMLCIAEHTEVLTQRGWVYIQNIKNDDLVHDGVELVSHSGLLYNGRKDTIAINGVYMTPEHEVLNESQEWQAASQNPRPYRPNIRELNMLSTSTFRWLQKALAIPLRMWNKNNQSRDRNKTRAHNKLRMQNTIPSIQAKNSWDVTPSSVCSVSQHDRPLSVTYSSSMEKLRRTRNSCMSPMAKRIRALLERYGFFVSTRTDARQTEQRKGVLESKLCLGNPNRTEQQPAVECMDRNANGENDNFTSSKTVQDKNDNATLQSKQLASKSLVRKNYEVKVFDITNCGKRKRFVVRGDNGPFIVHNCENIVQHLARLVVAEQLLMIAERYRIITMTHDEVVFLAKNREAPKALKFALECFRVAPDWCSDIPLDAEGGYDDIYSK